MYLTLQIIYQRACERVILRLRCAGSRLTDPDPGLDFEKSGVSVLQLLQKWNALDITDIPFPLSNEINNC